MGEDARNDDWYILNWNHQIVPIFVVPVFLTYPIRSWITNIETKQKHKEMVNIYNKQLR